MFHFIKQIILFISSIFAKNKGEKDESSDDITKTPDNITVSSCLDISEDIQPIIKSRKNKEKIEENSFIKELLEKEKFKKEQKKDIQVKEKKAKKEARKRNKKENRIFAFVCILILSSTITVPYVITLFFGQEVVLYATMYEEENGIFSIVYSFEEDLENLYSDTEAGDKLELRDLIWNSDIRSKITVKYIDEDSFITELPHELTLFDNGYIDYIQYGCPKYVKIILKVTSIKQIISGIEINKAASLS